MDLPPPPAGFTLDAGFVPPPPGFTLDTPQDQRKRPAGEQVAAPPPPPGFKIDASPGLLARANEAAKQGALALNRKIAETVAPLREGSAPEGSKPADTALSRVDPHPPVEEVDPKATFERLKARGAELKAKGIDPKTDPEYRELARKQAVGIRQNLESAATIGAPLGAIGRGVAGLVERAAPRGKAVKIEADAVKNAPDAAAAPADKSPSGASPVATTAGPPSGVEGPAPAPPAGFKLDAHPTEGPLTEPPALDKPRRLEDQLFQLRNLETADRLDALTALKKLPEDYTPELDEKLYHHEENPAGVPLAAREKAIYDEHVAPIRQEANALAADLEKVTGVKADLNDIYTPRYVAGRTRSYGEAIAQFMKGVETRFGGAATRTMRKTIDAQKGRDFFIAEHPETGDRALVYVAPDRSVLAFDGTPQPKQFGRLAGTTGPRAGAIVKSESGAYRLAQATTKEIEAQAQTRYIKSVMANRLDNLAKLRSAVRNAKYIEDLKADPAFPDYFKDAASTPVPPVTNGRQWRRPTLPQFQGFYVEPRIADAFDDFARTGNDVEGINRALQSVGRVMNGVMFINPKAHIDNVFNHMLVGRGLAGNIIHAPSTVRNLVRGAREVWNIGPEYRRALKAGLSLPYAKIVAGDVHAELLKRLGAEVAHNARPWNSLAVSMGYPNAKMMVKRWSQVPNRVLWAAQDAMMMSRVLELKERGIPLERAIRQSESEIPNYRVPGQVGGKGQGGRAIAELFGNPAFGRFGRYQFGRLRAYADMVKDAFGPSRNIGERAHAFDQMLMLGVYTFGVYAAYDAMWQAITGNPLAYTVRSGASAIPKAIEDVGEGRKKAGDLITSLFTIGVPIELASEVYNGRYGWSGQPIVRDADVRKALEGDDTRQHQIARDVVGFVARQFSTVGQIVNPSATDTIGQSLMRAGGVVSPTEEQEAARERAQRFDEKSARRRAQKQENR
jgi:hypothetical protein